MNSEGSKIHGNHVVRSAYPYPGSTADYAANDLIGTKMTFSDVVPADRGSGQIRSVTVIDLDGNVKAMDLFLFSSDLNTGIGATNWSTGDNVALAFADSDLLNCVGAVSISTGDYKATAATGAVAFKEVAIPFSIDSRTLYGLLKSKGAPAFSDSTKISIGIGIERDAA